MASEFDHAFICVSPGASDEASVLAAFGLAEGAPNVHPGQGTACRRFFFANSYLELLWVSDTAEAQSDLTQPTHLWPRWKNRADGACPFGLGFRPKGRPDTAPPFNTWEYRPRYLPDHLSLHVATNAAVLTEPMLFYFPSGLRPERYPGAKQSPLPHHASLREVTRVELTSPHADRVSAEFTALIRTGLVRLRSGPAYLLELGFDGEAKGQQADFRPSLPLAFHW